jgi:hypothetical protein
MDKHNPEVHVAVLDKGPSAETIYRRYDSPLWMSQLQRDRERERERESAQKFTIIVRFPQLLYWNATRSVLTVISKYVNV